MCSWMHILAWISHSCIVIHKLLVLDGSLHYVQCLPYAAILQIFLLFSMTWYCRIQLPGVSKQPNIRWCGFWWSIPLSVDYVWFSSIDRLSGLLHAHIAYEIGTAKIVAALCRISIVCMIWYRWIQFSAMFKRHDERWCGFRWSIPISIDYVWSVYIDRAIHTPWYSYCTWYSYIKNYRW